jgi:phospholipid/cholesterol/gamma-HCH transport system substrate-binding protein
MATATNRLVKTLNDSWIFELIDRPGEHLRDRQR